MADFVTALGSVEANTFDSACLPRRSLNALHKTVCHVRDPKLRGDIRSAQGLRTRNDPTGLISLALEPASTVVNTTCWPHLR